MPEMPSDLRFIQQVPPRPVLAAHVSGGCPWSPFLRLGLGACEAEWKLLCGTHNLLKLWRHTRRQAAPTPLAA
jgi:hypothetical protein